MSKQKICQVIIWATTCLFWFGVSGSRAQVRLHPDPTWVSGLASASRSVAWGDLNQDGIVTVTGESPVITGGKVYYLAHRPLHAIDSVVVEPPSPYCFDLESGWIGFALPPTSLSVDYRYSTTLDLAVGNFNQQNTVYLNSGGALLLAPSWVSLAGNRTNGVAWGDVDGDGDLDLACGNQNQRNTLYRNTVGALETTPIWSSNATNNTQSVAWGDLDGDGDLDLACGNRIQSNALYENIGGALDTVPIWTSTPSYNTQSVAWGDLDGDGDLDLTCGNDLSPNTVYLNVGGVLLVDPFWSSTPSNATESVAWGDGDGDGDLDLACGNDGAPNTVYLNIGGTLDTTPSWSSTLLMATRSVAWGDVDGDGYLDLACGNNNQPNTVYHNLGGSLDTVPSWSSNPTYASRSVAWADMNGDGNLDLACGNNNDPNTVYLSDNSAPTVTVVAPNGGDSLSIGEVDTIRWMAWDLFGVDSVSLFYSTNGGVGWDTVATGEPNDSVYPWLVPPPPSDSCLVRVVAFDPFLNQAMDESDSLFTVRDLTPPEVTVVVPNGGEVWIPGDTVDIQWVALDNYWVDSVSIFYSINAGLLWDTISTGEPNDSVYSWVVPDTPSESCLVRVRAFDPSLNQAVDESDSLFTIGDFMPPEVTVLVPNGGEVWMVGDTAAIEWVATDNEWVDSVNIFYSTDKGVLWDTISTGEPNDSLYTWWVPPPPSESCLVRVVAFDHSLNQAVDESDRLFAIRDTTPPEVTVVTPNGGEVWIVGDTVEVEWIALDNSWVDSVSIFYSTSGGFLWDTVATGEPNDSVYSWVVPNTPSEFCLVRVEALDPALNPGEDVSDSLFAILLMGVEELITSPLRPESYALYQNYPNPFTAVTSVQFSVPSGLGDQHVSLRIYDVCGRLIRNLFDETLTADQLPLTTAVRWDGRDDSGRAVASGIYFYRLSVVEHPADGQTGRFIETRRLVIIR